MTTQRPNHISRQAENERYIARWLAQIGPKNRTEAQDFHTLKLGQGAKSGTRVRYVQAMRDLDHATDGKPWAALDDKDIARFMAAKRLNGYATNTIRTDASYLKAFLKVARNEGQLPPRMVLAFRVLRNRNLPERPVLSRTDQEALMTAATNARDQVIIALLTEGGLRISEAANLDVGGVSFDDKGGAWLSMPSLDEGLKTGPRRVYIAEYGSLLHAYLETHPNRTEARAPLLLAYDHRRQIRSGTRLGPGGIWTALNRLQRKTGLRHFRPHDLRHTAITRAHQSGLSQIDLSERFWGRKDSKHAAHYVHNSDDHKERVARKAAGIDPNGNAHPSADQTHQKLAELRRLWAELMGTELPRQP